MSRRDLTSRSASILVPLTKQLLQSVLCNIKTTEDWHSDMAQREKQLIPITGIHPKLRFFPPNSNDCSFHFVPLQLLSKDSPDSWFSKQPSCFVCLMKTDVTCFPILKEHSFHLFLGLPLFAFSLNVDMLWRKKSLFLHKKKQQTKTVNTFHLVAFFNLTINPSVLVQQHYILCVLYCKDMHC